MKQVKYLFCVLVVFSFCACAKNIVPVVDNTPKDIVVVDRTDTITSDSVTDIDLVLVPSSVTEIDIEISNGQFWQD